MKLLIQFKPDLPAGRAAGGGGAGGVGGSDGRVDLLLGECVAPVTAAAEACSLLENVKLAHKALAQAALRQMSVAENLRSQAATGRRV